MGVKAPLKRTINYFNQKKKKIWRVLNHSTRSLFLTLRSPRRLKVEDKIGCHLKNLRSVDTRIRWSNKKLLLEISITLYLKSKCLGRLDI